MSSLRDRMYNYEVTPPDDGWQRIASALDEAEMQNDFPRRLYLQELDPPDGTWNRIAEQIQPQATVVRSWRIPSFVKYAAAAVLVGIVAFGIYRLAFKQSDSESYSATSQPPFDSGTGIKQPQQNNLATENEQTAVNETAQTGEPAPYVNIPRYTRATTSEKSVPAPKGAIFKRLETDQELSHSIYAYTDITPDISDRYVMLMTPEGNLIRMSKKWSDLLCCVSGEEQDADCRNQLKKWQEKIATATLSSAPGNFIDILGLVNSLDEGSGL